MQTPNVTLRWFTFLSVLVNVVLSTAFDRLGWGGDSMSEVTRQYNSLFVPAGYAFSIWGVIYAAFIIYAILQLLPAQRSKTIYDHLAVPVIVINLLGFCWQLIYSYHLLLLSVAVILVMLVAGMILFLRTQQAIWAQHRSKWLMVPASLFLGWISVATIANIAIWLVSIGWDGAYLRPGVWAQVLLVITILLSIFISFRYRDYIYPAVIAWASYAIFVALQTKETTVAQTAMYVAMAAIVLTIIAAIRNARIELRQNRSARLS